MKLLLIGCLHGRAPAKLRHTINKEKPDVLLYLGDLCDSDKLRDIEFGNWSTKELFEAAFSEKMYLQLVKQAAGSMQVPLKFLGSFRIPVFMIYGNSDFLDFHLKKMKIKSKGLDKSLPKNCKLLKDQIVGFSSHGERIYLAGFPGYRGLISKSSGNQTKRNKNFEGRLKNFVKKIRFPQQTIFMTHDVPYGKFDLVKMKKSPAYGHHVGERFFNRHINKKLLAFACSHMHEYHGLDHIKKTPVLTTGYGRLSQCTVLEIKNSKIIKIKFCK